MLKTELPEPISMLILQGRIIPFPLGLEKQGEGIASI